MRKIGFIGVESFDMLVYLTKITGQLGVSVMVLDLSGDDTLATAVGADIDLPVVNANEADFVFEESALKMCSVGYSILFINFGFNTTHSFVQKCDDIYFVTDLYPNHVQALLDVELAETQERFLILKDIVPYKNLEDVIPAKFEHYGITADTTYLIMQDEDTHFAKLDCLYGNVSGLKMVSVEMLNLLMIILSQNFLEGDLKTAIKQLTRR